MHLILLFFYGYGLCPLGCQQMDLYRSKERVDLHRMLFTNRLKAPPPNLPLVKGEESFGALFGINLIKPPEIGLRENPGNWLHGFNNTRSANHHGYGCGVDISRW